MTAHAAIDCAAMDVYEADVLQLKDGQTEDDIDAVLRKEAEELGLTLEVHASTTTRSQDCSRYSDSVDSRVSGSTDQTSTSTWSRERASFRSNNTPIHLTNVEIAASRRRSTSSSMFSMSTTSTNQSNKSPFRRLKGLGMLRMHRSSKVDTKTCPHCPKDLASQRRACHDLPCGHRLCTQALRTIVVESSSSARAQCCGIEIPDAFVQIIIRTNVLRDGEQYAGDISIELNRESRRPSSDSRVDSIADPDRKQHPEQIALSIRQRQQHDRFEAWSTRMKQRIGEQQLEMVQILKKHHQEALDQQAEAQLHDMAIAEDRQVRAEADLRTLQTHEIRDNATALKHMEAYCAGNLLSGEPHQRTITDQDHVELQKTRNARDAMNTRHTNAINILRGEQTRRMKMRAQRHEKEVHHLQAQHQKDDLALEQRYNSEEASLNEDCIKRRERLHSRWKIETMICLKRYATPSDDMPEVPVISDAMPEVCC